MTATVSPASRISRGSSTATKSPTASASPRRRTGTRVMRELSTGDCTRPFSQAWPRAWHDGTGPRSAPDEGSRDVDSHGSRPGSTSSGRRRARGFPTPRRRGHRAARAPSCNPVPRRVLRPLEAAGARGSPARGDAFGRAGRGRDERTRAGGRPGEAEAAPAGGLGTFLQRHTFEADVWKCPCGGRRRLLAVVTPRATAEEVLYNLGLGSARALLAT